MKATIALAAALFTLAPAAFAASADNATDAQSAKYEYGMKLDVQKVISLTDVSQEVGVVPVTMVYQDSQGAVQTVQFLQLGGQNTSG
ncbi:MAG: DUF2790 domain-containing protein [Pseudomonas sp.]|uniref:DUF2790 domain-containing protein n=1 Tax=Pseudomonas sp. TaxID=306 RepID=UPI003D0E8500